MYIAENRNAFRKYGAADDYVKWVKFPILAASFLVPRLSLPQDMKRKLSKINII